MEAEVDFNELHQLRLQAHRLLDPLWEGSEERTRKYKWLADQLGIDPADCHISMFDIVTVRKAIDILRA